MSDHIVTMSVESFNHLTERMEAQRKWIDTHIDRRQDGDDCPDCGGNLLASTHAPNCPVPSLIAKW